MVIQKKLLSTKVTKTFQALLENIWALTKISKRMTNDFQLLDKWPLSIE